MTNDTHENIGLGIVGAVVVFFFIAGASEGIITALLFGVIGFFAGCFLLTVLSAFGIIYQDGSSWFS